MIVLFALYALQRHAQPDNADVAAVLAPAPTAIVVPAPTSQAPPAPAGTTAADAAIARLEPTQTPLPPTATAEGAFRDGAYQGTEANAYWGTVEVKAIITDGQLRNVVFLTYPNHRNRSVEINDRAMPILIQEAIQSQGAEVDFVSGATDTSDAFIQSLSAALSQAT